MSNIIVHALAMIGVLVVLLFLCKFIFLIILWVKRNGNPDKYWSIVKHSMFSDNYEDSWFLIPTIMFTRTSYKDDWTIEISIKWLKWEYYTNYQLSNEV